MAILIFIDNATDTSLVTVTRQRQRVDLEDNTYLDSGVSTGIYRISIIIDYVFM